MDKNEEQNIELNLNEKSDTEAYKDNIDTLYYAATYTGLFETLNKLMDKKIESMKSSEKVIVPLEVNIAKAGVSNRNNTVISEEVYTKMIKQAQQLADNGEVQLIFDSDESDNEFGDVVFINNDEIEVEVEKSKLDILKETIDNNYVAACRCFTDIKENEDGTIEVTDLSIAYCDLIKEEN